MEAPAYVTPPRSAVATTQAQAVGPEAAVLNRRPTANVVPGTPRLWGDDCEGAKPQLLSSFLEEGAAAQEGHGSVWEWEKHMLVAGDGHAVTEGPQGTLFSSQPNGSGMEFLPPSLG